MVEVTDIQVHYVTDGKEKVANIIKIRQHCRKERVEDLVGDAALLCEEVEANRRPGDPGRTLRAVP